MEAITSPAQVMVRAGQHIQTLTDALRTFSLERTLDVLNAYDRLTSLERREMRETTLPPRNHALWIHGLNLGLGVHVVDVAHAHRMSNDLSLTGAVDASSCAVDVPIDHFDHVRHALLCTDLSLLSYLAGNDHLLGTNAHVVSPYFKHALVWWTD